VEWGRGQVRVGPGVAEDVDGRQQARGIRNLCSHDDEGDPTLGDDARPLERGGGSVELEAACGVSGGLGGDRGGDQVGVARATIGEVGADEVGLIGGVIVGAEDVDATAVERLRLETRRGEVGFAVGVGAGLKEPVADDLGPPADEHRDGEVGRAEEGDGAAEGAGHDDSITHTQREATQSWIVTGDGAGGSEGGLHQAATEAETLCVERHEAPP